jgi:hypothetical protein
MIKAYASTKWRKFLDNFTRNLTKLIMYIVDLLDSELNPSSFPTSFKYILINWFYDETYNDKTYNDRTYNNKTSKDITYNDIWYKGTKHITTKRIKRQNL